MSEFEGSFEDVIEYLRMKRQFDCYRDLCRRMDEAVRKHLSLIDGSYIGLSPSYRDQFKELHAEFEKLEKNLEDQP